MSKPKKSTRPRYDVFVGQCAAFILDNHSRSLDPVCKTYPFGLKPDGRSDRHEVSKTARIRCARLNREDHYNGIQKTDRDA
jgi:hypothetical protein